ncbi:MAG: pyridoxal phosphate-dependent aminotransferase [Pseudomonadota bacterium]|nr:pyridoxal phosphate-dependent aminotransferase [Pseudomonadota bacterium]
MKSPLKVAPIRPEVLAIETQQIMQVSTLAMDDPEVIAMWYGESDVSTPDFICAAATEALRRGQTFYTHKWGIPKLRETLAAYTCDLYGVNISTNRVTVTSSGMTGIMILMQALVGSGDNIILVDPIWPNGGSAAQVMGGEVRRVSLEANSQGNWHLDLEKLFAATDSRTRMIFINSPGNPTGWMVESDQQKEILNFCRNHRIWIVADEVYSRLVYDRRVAPSFLEIAEPEDPVVVVNSFSKSWAMTGWRLGWLTHPERLKEKIGDLIEYNTSGTPEFLQEAGITAVRDGEDTVTNMIERCRAGRDAASCRLSAMNRVTYSPPAAAFYAFFKVDGIDNSLDFAKRLATEYKVGVAPGTAFGPSGEGWLRICFAQSTDRIDEAMNRLERAMVEV